MKKLFLTLALSLMASPAMADPFVRIGIVNDTANGSGVHIGNGYYVTANHVVYGDGQVIEVDGVSYTATVVIQNETYDLAVLRGPILDDYVRFDCFSGMVGDSLIGVGWPLGDGRTVKAGKIDSVMGQFIVSDIAVEKGMSGGAVLRGDGLLAGVMVGFLNDNGFGIISPVEAICEVLEV